MITSGTAAAVTSGDGAVTLLNPATGRYSEVAVVNEGATAGFWSVDGGSTWARLPAGPCSVSVGGPLLGPFTVQVKRVAGGTDLSGIWAWAW